MTFFEEHARLLLVLHTILATAAVAASTHLVLWLRKLIRGQSGQLRAVRRFALYAAALHLATFLAGNLMYPTYKVRVKAGYLQDPQAVLDEGADRIREAAQVERRFGDAGSRTAPDPTEGQIARATADLPGDAEQAHRWFDTKEHWVAMGLILALGLALILPTWKPEPGEGAEITPVVVALALCACASLWFGAVVGVLTASWRAVG